MPCITYCGQPVALVGRSTEFVVPTIRNRDDDDPVKRFVLMLVNYARAAYGAPSPRRARPVSARSGRAIRARGAHPGTLFRALSAFHDAELASIFNVPVEQAAARRSEVALPRGLR
jgi:hypothetical protein